jgi:hypothetical protein
MLAAAKTINALVAVDFAADDGEGLLGEPRPRRRNTCGRARQNEDFEPETGKLNHALRLPF